MTREEYEKNPKLCKHCGKPIPWEKRNNIYCSSSCAASENNKGVIRNPKGAANSLEEVKTRQQILDELKSRNHNRVLLKNYLNYNISKILPGCCPICGEYHCENEFCKKHNFQQLIGLVKHFGFDPTAIGTSKVFDEFERIRNLIYDLYWNQKMSMIDIKAKFNYTSLGTVFKLFDSLDIDKRNPSQSVKNSILMGKDIGKPEQKFNQSWHTTWTGEEVFLRSSYELDYAEYLDSNQISYSVEELRIEYFDSQQNKTRIAIPDFYISSTNEIVEIKSDFTLDIQEMLDKFKAYKNLGYIPKLILEKEEIDLYNIENEVGEERFNKINNSHFKRP